MLGEVGGLVDEYLESFVPILKVGEGLVDEVLIVVSRCPVGGVGNKGVPVAEVFLSLNGEVIEEGGRLMEDVGNDSDVLDLSWLQREELLRRR